VRVALVAQSRTRFRRYLAGSLRETAEVIGAAGGIALPIAADLPIRRDRAAIVAEVERELGPVDVLVNNAAACFYLSIDETSERRLRVAYVACTACGIRRQMYFRLSEPSLH
jgi:NAD(P)-dependent dehydrogenase (short-subunit alcohol dehydrogenase family)